MSVAKMTSKGQVTVPIEVRKSLRLSAGARVEFLYNEDTGCYEFLPAKRSIKSFAGFFNSYKRAKPLTIEEMNEIIAEQGASAG